LKGILQRRIFYHIVKPLTIHSKENTKFRVQRSKDVATPLLYERNDGIFCGKCPGKVWPHDTPDEYLAVIRGKMLGAALIIARTFRSPILAQFTLTQYGDQYGNRFTRKGRLIGLCLDIKLRKLSNGKYGVQNMIADLSKKYRKRSSLD